MLVHILWDLGEMKFLKILFVLCKCTDNVSKEKYVCTLTAVQIHLHVNSQPNGFHKPMVFMIIVFMNTQKNILERKTVSKSAP